MLHSSANYESLGHGEPLTLTLFLLQQLAVSVERDLYRAMPHQRLDLFRRHAPDFVDNGRRIFNYGVRVIRSAGNI